MKTLTLILSLTLMGSLAANAKPGKQHHRIRTSTKTTGIANARAHGGRALAKGHRVHKNTSVHSADIYWAPTKTTQAAPVNPGSPTGTAKSTGKGNGNSK